MSEEFIRFFEESFPDGIVRRELRLTQEQCQYIATTYHAHIEYSSSSVGDYNWYWVQLPLPRLDAQPLQS